MQSCYMWDVCPWFPPSRCLCVSSSPQSRPFSLASAPLNKLLFKRWKWGQSFWTRELKARWGQGSQGQRMCAKRMKPNPTVQRGSQQLFLSHKEGRPSLGLTSHSSHSCFHEGVGLLPKTANTVFLLKIIVWK